MSLLDPKPLLPGKLDEAVTELATTPGSAFATAQSATYADKAATAASLLGKADVRAIRVGTRSRLHAAPIKHMIPASMPGHGWAVQSDMSPP